MVVFTAGRKDANVIFDRKKQRGQRRRLKALLENMQAFVPFESVADAYEHFHVPSGPFIQSPKTSRKIKTAFCRGWLAATREFIARKPAELPFCKVVCVIDAPNFWESQIIIFYSQAYYDAFWSRKGAAQKWEALDDRALSFAKARNMTTGLLEKGYAATFCDGDGCCRRSVLWFYGDL